MNPTHISYALRIIRQGGVIAYPTEAVFGLGCAAHCESAVHRILALKSRKPDRGLILVGAHVEQLAGLVVLDGLERKQEILDSWPGPVTWILPAKPGVPAWLTGKSRGLAVRISAHPQIRALCQKSGLLVSTSANPARCQPARSVNRVRAYFADSLDYILPGEVDLQAKPSEIRDAMSGRVVRSGKT